MLGDNLIYVCTADAETIKEFVSFIQKGVDLIDHTSIFLLRTINHYVTFIMCTLPFTCEPMSNQSPCLLLLISPALVLRHFGSA